VIVIVIVIVIVVIIYIDGSNDWRMMLLFSSSIDLIARSLAHKNEGEATAS
jgi:hypothetical protein